MKFFGQLESAQIENVTSDPTPTATTVGRVIYRTDTNELKICDSTPAWRKAFVSLDGSIEFEGLVATPSGLPQAGSYKVYFKNDGLPYYLDSAGLEQPLGSGVGSLGTFYQETFDITDVGVYTTTGSWTKANDTVAPIKDARSALFTQVAGSLGAKHQVTEAIVLQPDQIGVQVKLKGRYLAANGQNYSVNILESTDGISFSETASVDLTNSSAVQNIALVVTTNTSSTHLKYEFEVINENIGDSLKVDSIEFTVEIGEAAQSTVVAAGARSNNSQTVVDGGVVIYEDEEYDTHNAYNPATGVFTVPVGGAGFYRASASMRRNVSGGSQFLTRIVIQKNSGNYARFYAGTSSVDQVASGSCTLSLAEGDTVRVIQDIGVTIGTRGTPEDNTFFIEKIN